MLGEREGEPDHRAGWTPRFAAAVCPRPHATESEQNGPIVTVQQSPREVEQKRTLVAAITQAFIDSDGVRPEHVQVVIHEVDHENWAKAGKLAIDR
jgi:4-oxalocrotonate tautomerase